MWFNKIYKIKQLKPNYINIKINGMKPTKIQQIFDIVYMVVFFVCFYLILCIMYSYC
jgi:hypothetical protein